MTTDINNKICVILGAGASYDVRNEGSPLKNGRFRPPLAKDLFDLEEHPEYWEVMAEYPGAINIAQEFAPKSKQRNFNLESELRHIADHPTLVRREHYKHVPPYLRDLLVKCSREYTQVPSCYIQLVRILLAESTSDVLFLVLNYDDLLERALVMFDSEAYKFTSMNDYIEASRPAKVVKLHGSTTWFKVLSGRGDWRDTVKASGVLERTSDAEIQVAHNPNPTHNLVLDGGMAYPILTAPLAGKGVADMVCPQSHIEYAKSFLKDCSRFMVIGTSGLDDDLLELLGESIHVDLPLTQFVAGDRKAAAEVCARFRANVSSFGNVTDPPGGLLFESGFRDFTDSGAAESFARHAL